MFSADNESVSGHIWALTKGSGRNPQASIIDEPIGSQTIAVNPGQIVELENDDEGCEIEIEGAVLEIEGPDIFLDVTCNNSVGSDTAQAVPTGLAPDNDSPTDDDD